MVRGVDDRESGPQLSAQEPDYGLPTLLGEIGCDDNDFAVGFHRQLETIGSVGGQYDLVGLLHAASAVRGLEPRDQIEATFGAQMAATQNAIVMLFSQLSSTPSIEVQESAERSYSRMSRLYIQQVDAFTRYRARDLPKQNVGQIKVEAGGQAFLGAVTQNVSPMALAPPGDPPIPAEYAKRKVRR